LTYKENGKTRSVYVPKQLLPEVRTWLAEHKRLKTLLHEIHQLSVALLRARARFLKLKAGPPCSGAVPWPKPPATSFPNCVTGSIASPIHACRTTASTTGVS